MALVVAILSTITLGIGLVGVVSPPALNALVARFSTRRGMWAAIVLRLVFGFALFRAAPASRTPSFFQVLGALSMASSVLLSMVGLPRYLAILAWWSRQGGGVKRAWALAASAMGALLLWSVH
jgi:hypothetical protein